MSGTFISRYLVNNGSRSTPRVRSSMFGGGRATRLRACILYQLPVALLLAGCAAGHRWRPVGADANPEEEAAVLDAVDTVLVAMGRRDQKAYAASLTADGMTYSQRLVDGQWQLRRRSNKEDIDLLNEETEPLLETYWQPTVLIRGPIAVVWAPYEFRKGGVVTHCGVDVFDMLKIDGQWAMGNAMWTVEPEACAELKLPPGTRWRSDCPKR